MSKIRLPIGISDFKELIKGEYLFVDKTLLIKDIMSDGAKVILITRPRRFGKTLNLSMLYHFLQHNQIIDENLFENLDISKDIEFCSKHQQKYPVIFISFKDIKQSNYMGAYNDIIELMSVLYEEHRYLLNKFILSSSEKTKFMAILNKKALASEIQSAIKQLSVYMTRKFGKPCIILMDEYDTPIQEAYLKGYYDEMIDLMRSILGQAFKDNSYIAKAVITGITRVSQESLFSGLNNLSVYSLLREKLGQYFGFTEDEVIKLIANYNGYGENISLSGIKDWYNGYQIGKHVLYNPWSIINCLDNDGTLQPYWVNTSSNDLIGKLLSNASPLIKQQFEDLLQKNIIEQPLAENLVFADIETREEALWSLLLHAGYLKALSYKFHNNRFMAEIAIPNKEINFVYDRAIEKWFSAAINLDSYDKFVKSLAEGDIEKFKLYLSSYIMQTGSYFDFNTNTAEQIFHVFILGLVVGLRQYYIIHSNKESGLGRFDVIFIPKNTQKQGIVLEFKTTNDSKILLSKAQEALQQIKDKQYIEIFKQYEISLNQIPISILAIGIAFCGKQMELIYEHI